MKLHSKKGFTLMEMLIVVAIIAILVAILIPTFSGQLNKAKWAADEANVRGWYAEQVMELMLDEDAEVPTSCDLELQTSGATAVPDGDSIANFSVTLSDGDGNTITFGADAE